MNNEEPHICEHCGKEFFGDWRKCKEKQPPKYCSRSCSNSHKPSQKHKEKTRASIKKFYEESAYHCRYCKQACKDDDSLNKHEQSCKCNPSVGGHRKPPHTRHYYTRPMILKTGIVLDVSRAFVDKYKKDHPVCEICGRSVEETVKTKSKFSPHNLCIDHDHNTMKFRGVLCSLCNRQLGWYEKNKDAINRYLDKGSVV